MIRIIQGQVFCILFLGILCGLLCSCSGDGHSPDAEIYQEKNDPIVISLLGDTLHPLSESAYTIARKDSLLKIAKENFGDDPNNLDNIIWYGRRVAYLYHYRDAIDIFTKGIELHPDAPELYRHRGHRYISIRQFDNAIKDFQKAAELAEGIPVRIEKDGIPNKLNIPLSSMQFNIYYHWALAHYLKGELEIAAPLWEQCMKYSTNPDLLVATTDWYYMTLRRLEKDEEAEELLEKISSDMNIIENASYHKRLLMYKGEMQPEELLNLDNDEASAQLDMVTQGYGVGNWFLYNGDAKKANEVFQKIIECKYWPAFGYIAAEAELYRRK